MYQKSILPLLSKGTIVASLFSIGSYMKTDTVSAKIEQRTVQSQSMISSELPEAPNTQRNIDTAKDNTHEQSPDEDMEFSSSGMLQEVLVATSENIDTQKTEKSNVRPPKSNEHELEQVGEDTQGSNSLNTKENIHEASDLSDTVSLNSEQDDNNALITDVQDVQRENKTSEFADRSVGQSRSAYNYQAEFLNKIKPGAINGWHKYNILPSITAAQGILESGWGQSKLSKQANNLFGVKGTYKGKSINFKTREETPQGHSYYVRADFRLYPSWAESIEDHGRFLNVNRRYHKLIGETDYKKVAHLLKQAGYATAWNYAQLLIQIVEDNQLYQWDQEAFNGYTNVSTANNYGDEQSGYHQIYTVVSGDSLWGIANKHSVSLNDILTWNKMTESTVIYPGDKIIVGKSGNNTITNDTIVQIEQTYTVVSGDSLWGIANKHGVSLNDLLTWNNMTESTVIYPGDKIIVGKSGDNTTTNDAIAQIEQTYTVVSGDSLWGIANKHGVSLNDLLTWNKMTESTVIYPGDKIIIKK